MPQPGKSLWPIAFAIHQLEQCADLWVRGVHGKRLWVVERVICLLVAGSCKQLPAAAKPLSVQVCSSHVLHVNLYKLYLLVTSTQIPSTYLLCTWIRRAPFFS